MIERCCKTPLGAITISVHDDAVTSVTWREGRRDAGALLDTAEAQLAAYFDGTLERFELPLMPAGSDVQKRACAAMGAIAFGETSTYGALAKELKVSAQAMGQLCGGNPIPIFIPCHRVLGANGLGGFSGGRGVDDKVWLLRHEGAAGLLI
ncbi:methylated-DNA--[protein]-cysteine S-methyltransferase [Roseobacteraceae bacterium S113]